MSTKSFVWASLCLFTFQTRTAFLFITYLSLTLLFLPLQIRSLSLSLCTATLSTLAREFPDPSPFPLNNMLLPTSLLALVISLLDTCPAHASTLDQPYINILDASPSLRNQKRDFRLYTAFADSPQVTGAAGSPSSVSAAVGNAFAQPMLTPPAPPGGQDKSIAWRLWDTADGYTNTGGKLSVQQRGNFLGFSIEMSVSNQICERDIHRDAYFRKR